MPCSPGTTHLDDLVTHLASDESSEVAELGATCLYAVYDPVSRRLNLAAAGHPAPALLLPDGSAALVEMSAGPPSASAASPSRRPSCCCPRAPCSPSIPTV